MQAWWQKNRDRVTLQRQEKFEQSPETFRAYWNKSNAKHREEDRERQKALWKRTRHLPSKVARIMWNSAKTRARKRGFEFSITREWVQERLDAGHCEVSKIPFVIGQRRSAYSPSIDRKDNALGYTPENCRLILFAVNWFKGEWAEADMWTIAEAMIASRAKTRA